MTNTQSMSNELYQKDLNLAAWFQVTGSDYQSLIQHLKLEKLFPIQQDAPYRVLDFGSGSGRFPHLVAEQINHSNPSIAYDAIDISPHSLKLLKANISAPFYLDHTYSCSFPKFQGRPDGDSYHLAYAIHSLYCLDPGSFVPSLMKIIESVRKTQGNYFIYHASASSFYHQIFNLYRKHFTPDTPRFVTAEDLFEALEELGEEVEYREIKSHAFVPLKEKQLLESFLKQCVMDKEIRLETLLEEVKIKKYLDRHLTENGYKFPQQVHLIAPKSFFDSGLFH